MNKKQNVTGSFVLSHMYAEMVKGNCNVASAGVRTSEPDSEQLLVIMARGELRELFKYLIETLCEHQERIDWNVRNGLR